MPTSPLSDAACREALEALDRHGGNKSLAASELGLSRSTFRGRLDVANMRGLHLSEGIRTAADNAQLSYGEAKGGWIHNYDDEGKKVGTTRWSAPEADTESLIERLQGAFTDIPAAPAIEPPGNRHTDLCTVYPLMDVHYGMRAWGAETGDQNYDMDIAGADMRYALGKLDMLTPASEKAILIVGGDFTHANDENAQTPQSKHNLDVDGRHWKVLDESIAILCEVIDKLAAKHAEVMVRVLRGNHDQDAYLVLTFALFERYRENPRIVIEKSPRDLFMTQWGKCLIASHHGDKAKPERLAMYLSDVCTYWSETRHRHVFTGHIHHDSAKDIGPLRWESLRAFCPPDSYAASMGYAGRRAIQSITFHKQDGIVLRAIDPIERPHEPR